MKSTDLIFKNGHFYNKSSGKRMLFKEGQEYHLVGISDDSFELAPPAGRVKKALSSEELALKLKLKSFKIDYHKILDKGAHLFFSFSPKNDDKVFEFKAELQEDLYLYKPKNKPNEEYAMFDCYSKTIENTSKNLMFFEEVSGKSLNDLFKCTYIHYIGNKGNPAANAITSFYLEKDKKTNLNDLRNRLTRVK